MRLSRWLLPAIVFAVAVLEYVNTIPYDYAWDDKLVITANDYTLQGVKGLPAIFTQRVSIPFKSEYRPVPQAMFAIEHQLFNGSPHASHALNVFWYALACVCVYAFVRFTFSRLEARFAFLAALLFTVHPLHVEVVANIKSRDEILCLLFGLSSIMLIVKGIERKLWPLLLAGAACFIIACLSKSNAVTFLPIMALVAWYRLHEVKLSRKVVVLAGIAATCSVLIAVIIRYSQSTVSSTLDLHLNSTVLNNIFLWTAHPETVIPTALVIIARYLLLFLWPHPLIHLYGYNQIPLSTWGDAATWLVLLGLIAVTVLLFKNWRRKTAWAFGILFFAITYSVYSNFFFFAPDTMADRYMFVPSVGLSILAVSGLCWLASGRESSPWLSNFRSKALLALFGCVLAAYLATSISANADWRNDFTLIYNRIGYMQQNAAAQAVYGYMLNKESEIIQSPQLRQEKKAAAMKAFMQAIRIYPDFQSAWIAVGKIFAEESMFDKAELAFLKAQSLQPLTPDSYFCLGTVYFTLRDSDLAIPYLEKAILLDNKMEDGYVMLGRAYLQADNIDNLGAMTATARRWFPNNADLQALQATYYFRKKDYSLALTLAKETVAKEPQNVLALAIISSPMTQTFASGPQQTSGK